MLRILVHIQEEINLNNNSHNPKIIAVSKTFKMDNILPLIEYMTLAIWGKQSSRSN